MMHLVNKYRFNIEISLWFVFLPKPLSFIIGINNCNLNVSLKAHIEMQLVLLQSAETIKQLSQSNNVFPQKTYRNTCLHISHKGRI